MEGSASEVNAAQPPTLDHFLGQRQVVEQVRVGLEAVWNEGRGARFPHTLMVGPKGTGKTLMGRIIAAEIGGTFKETLGQTLGAGQDVFDFLLTIEDGSVLFVDEIHTVEPSAQVILFRAVEEGKLMLPISNRVGGNPVIPLPRFTFIAATTDPQRLLAPLIDRFRLTLSFQLYQPEEIEQLVRQRAQLLRWEAQDEVFLMIACRSKRTPRLAMRLLENVWRVARSEGSRVLSVAHLERACRLADLDTLGLDLAEQQYLRLLRETRRPVRLHEIAARLNLPVKQVQAVIEPLLLREGLIERTEDGRRTLSEVGAAHLNRS